MASTQVLAPPSAEIIPAEQPINEEEQEAEHPLHTSWSFLYDKKIPKKTDFGTYQSNLHKLGSFDTVEEFWRHYVHVKRPSQLQRDTSLYLFRNIEGYKPMWEAFPNGGCWILKIKKGKRVGQNVARSGLCCDWRSFR